MTLGQHLRLAKGELEQAHAAALLEDKVFAHDLMPLLFAMGVLEEAWEARRLRVGELRVERGTGAGAHGVTRPTSVQTSGPAEREADDRQHLSCGGQPE